MQNSTQIQLDNILLDGIMNIPKGSKKLILFAHGSGSGKLSPRNNFVASLLNQSGLSTLLVDLLTEEEDSNVQTRFNIELLTERLGKIVFWIENQEKTKNLSIGLFGASTGAAAALKTAALLPKKIFAVVSRGGRPDLAMRDLPAVRAPTLLIVGGHDFDVIKLNQSALAALTCTKKLVIIPDATHLFEEPGCLEQVADLAREWFILN